MLGIRLVTLITAFGIAIVKAYLVCTHFMHLNIEKRWVAYILAFMILMMVVFFAGVSPDVLKSSGHQWRKTYVEPAAGAAHPAEH
jgi:caa(3)-type oxidase subunit IV